ncbi:MAG: nucleotidyltransferase domain-containing protein [Candidatus Diapherotrites archaeon]|nr:nucleotidyltransferase domain-containing protein [Candidatus Diapherotrites archaeon]
MLLQKSRQRVLSAILRNPGIHVNGLIRLVGSLRGIKGILDELEKAGLIYSKHVGNIRQIFPLLGSSFSVSTFELVEEQEKQGVMSKFSIAKSLVGRIDLFKKIFGQELVSIALFGSIARGHLTETSDIDILFIVKKEKTVQKNKLVKLFQTISLNTGREINPVIIEEGEFKKQLTKDSSFARQVQKERIILCNPKEFLSLQNI